MAPRHNPLVAQFGSPAPIPPLPSGTSGSYVVIRARVRRETPGRIELDGATGSGLNAQGRLTCAATGVTRWEREPACVRAQAKLAHRPGTPPPVVVDLTHPDQISLVGEDLTIQVNLDPFHIAFVGADGQTLLTQEARPVDVTERIAAPGFGISCKDSRVVATHDTFVCAPDEHFYRFGEKFTNFDKRGQWLEMWNYDAYGVNSERSYKNVPFFVSSRGYGLFVDSGAPVRFDMAATHHSVFSVINPDAGLDYYVLPCAAPLEVIRRYADLVGHPTLPPKWAFGLWVSSGFKADNAEATVGRARDLPQPHIPPDFLPLHLYLHNFPL